MIPATGVARVVPDSLDGLTAAMQAAFERGDAVTFAGGGTEVDLGYPLERVDAVISTERLGRIVEYAPDDMTVTVEAGVTLDALQRMLADHGQRLSIDPPAADRATVGGALATDGFGPLRARFGGFRDLLLGATLVRADGVRVRGGGKVVKNVAGFDVPKLLVGSLGSLGCIATATFRLHPLPEAQRSIAFACPTARSLREACTALVDAQLEPSRVVAVNAAGGFDVRVQFEGFRAGVDEQAATARARLRALGLAPRDDDRDGAAEFRARHDAARTSGALRVKATFPPAELGTVYGAALAPHAQAFGDGAVVLYPTVGIAFCSSRAASVDRAVAAPALLAARDVFERSGGTFVLAAAPGAVREQVDVFGTLPPAFALMREIKARFDPQRRCNRGRFVGHL